MLLAATGTVITGVSYGAYLPNFASGFSTVAAETTPIFIRKASQSVFRVVIPAFEGTEDERFIDLRNGVDRAVLENIERNFSTGWKATIIRRQIENCLDKRNLAHCPVMTATSRAPAFSQKTVTVFGPLPISWFLIKII